jgi:hypothetical protein
MSEEYKFTDFIKSVTHNKKDIIGESESPETVEKAYPAYAINKILSRFPDTILHANEMNMCHGLSNDAQYRYYLNMLRPRNRFRAAHQKDKTLEENTKMVQVFYQCNRTTAKQYIRVLKEENLITIRDSMQKGG